MGFWLRSDAVTKLPVLCVAVRAVACRFSDGREMFRTHKWEISWTCKWWIFCAKAEHNFTNLLCIVENTDKCLGRCTDNKVSEPPTNVTQILVESHIPKIKDVMFPVGSWKAGTVGGKLVDRYKIGTRPLLVSTHLYHKCLDTSQDMNLSRDGQLCAQSLTQQFSANFSSSHVPTCLF